MVPKLNNLAEFNIAFALLDIFDCWISSVKGTTTFKSSSSNTSKNVAGIVSTTYSLSTLAIFVTFLMYPFGVASVIPEQ